LTPNHWNLLVLFFFSADGAATASTAVLAAIKRLPKRMMESKAESTSYFNARLGIEMGSQTLLHEFRKTGREKREREDGRGGLYTAQKDDVPVILKLASLSIGGLIWKYRSHRKNLPLQNGETLRGRPEFWPRSMESPVIYHLRGTEVW
jgi:hypothetical protein